MAENPNKPDLPVVSRTASFTYRTPVVYEPEDNETYANRITTPVLRSNSMHENIFNERLNGWNCERCSNDDDFCMPIVDGDFIYLQVMVNDPVPNPYGVKPYDREGNEISAPGAVDAYNVKDKENGNNYLNIIVNTALIPSNCFYFALTGTTCRPGWEDCYELMSEAAVTACLASFCNQGTEIFSDLYCKVDESCTQTLLIEGDYAGGYDCDGNFYGIPFGATVNQQFKLKFRVPATIERREYGFTETLLNSKKIKSKQSEIWNLRTQKIPPYVVDLMAKAFNSKQITIDGVEYTKALKLSKNFEDGSMWIVNETLTKDCDEINYSCKN